MAISFRARLLLIFISLLGLTLAATLWAVLRATDANARANADRELAVAERVFETLLDENSRQLTDRTTLLAEDFGFKQAIATNEEDTIVSALANHGDRIGADMIVLMAPDGEVLLSTHAIGDDLGELRTAIDRGQGAFNLLTLAEGEPYQLVMVPVDAPERIAWVGMGFVMDTGLLDGFRDITNTHVTLLYRDADSGPVRTLGTLPAEVQPQARLTGGFESALDQASSRLGEEGWLNRRAVLKDRPDQQLGYLLSVSLQQALAAYDGLRAQMLGIAALALALAAVATVLIAGGITRPIETLVGAARRIASGDYSRGVTLHERNEFGVLSDTLNAMQAAIREREEHILYQAQHDLLTGLPNRDQLGTRLTERLAGDRVAPFGVLLIQIVNYDALSDVYGISVMDRVLRLVAQRLDDARRVRDEVARSGTDEFMLVAEGLTPAQSPPLAEHCLGLFEAPFSDDAIEVKVEARIGVLLCPDQARTFEDLMRRSHLALVEARHQGGRYALYQDGQDERHLRKIAVTHRLQQAVVSGGFELKFQPQYDLGQRRLRSVEALIRWQDDELGAMFPDEFIPLAEQSGAITQITGWVLDEAIRQLGVWRAAGYPDLGVSINLSARDILKDSFIDILLERLEREALIGRVTLEITESAMMMDTERALANLQRLYDAGIELAMDDFGTGFSSLAQLKSMPIHELKIDKSFVLRLDQDADDQRIVRSTIEMAHHLGLKVMAEGVENQASLALLDSMGCDGIQGYYLTRALPVVELTDWMAQFNERQEQYVPG